MSDIMDEFEFKPLTEGLGFQKKNNEPAKTGLSTHFSESLGADFAEKFSDKTPEATPTRPAVKNAINNSLNAFNQFEDINTKAGMDAAIAHLEKGGTFGKNMIPELKPAPAAQKPAASLNNPLSTPLPRAESRIDAKAETSKQAKKTNLPGAVPTTSVDEILKTLQDKKMPQLSPTAARQRIDATPEPEKFQKSTWDFAAVMLDAMLVIASNLMCLIILMFTTHVDLFSNLFNPDSAGMIYKSMAALVLGTTWIYLVVNRIFIGCTPGEWVFDQRIGFPKETGSAMYSLKIVARATLTVCTGLILFPIASALMNEDILGTWMDLQMMKKS